MKTNHEIKKIVNNVVQFTVTNLKNKGLISLYVSGSILTEDRNQKSDIDLFGIVEQNFDFNNEEELNKLFIEKQEELCKGIETRFHGVTITALQGGDIGRSVVGKKNFGVKTLIKRIPFYTQVWGKKFDFKKDFSITPFKLKDDALRQIEITKDAITDFLKDKKTKKFEKLLKNIINLVAIEAEKEKGFSYDPSYSKLTRHLKKEDTHIIHKAMKLRNNDATQDEMIQFCSDAEEYIKEILKRVKKWD